MKSLPFGSFELHNKKDNQTLHLLIDFCFVLSVHQFAETHHRVRLTAARSQLNSTRSDRVYSTS